MTLRYQVTQVVLSVYRMSCGLGGALSNLTLFPCSTFVIIKLSGLSSSRTWPCRPLPLPTGMVGVSAKPPPQARVDSNCWVVGEDIALWMRYPGSSSTTSVSQGLQMSLSHHQQEFQPFSFRGALSPGALSGMSQPRSRSCHAPLWMSCQVGQPLIRRRAHSLPFGTEFLVSFCSFGLSITFSSLWGLRSFPPTEKGALSPTSHPGELPVGSRVSAGTPLRPRVRCHL